MRVTLRGSILDPSHEMVKLVSQSTTLKECLLCQRQSRETLFCSLYHNLVVVPQESSIKFGRLVSVCMDSASDSSATVLE
jgi:hypothetical protein